MYAGKWAGIRGSNCIVEPPITQWVQFAGEVRLNHFRPCANGLPIKERVETPPHRANIVIFESGENKL